MRGKLVFALVGLFLGLASAARAATTISLPALSGDAVGSDVTFPVNIASSDSIGGFTVQIQYDPAVLSILDTADVTKGPRAGSLNLLANIHPPLLATNPSTTAGVRAVFYGTSSVGSPTGVFFNIKFRVVGLGSTPLIVTICDVNDPPVACAPTPTNGSFSTNVCAPAAETCDGQDDDCNGQIDNGFDVGAACSTGVGACQRNGVKECTADGTGTTCTAIPGEPGVEGPFGHVSCEDDVDNDCDGETDETDADCLPPALNSLIPGGGGAATDCMVEWEIVNLSPAANKKGLPLTKQECVDGDLCDADSAADGHCTFLLSACVNVPDPRLLCPTSNVAFIDVKGLPTEMTAAFVDLGGYTGGQCANEGEKKGQGCRQDSDCDTVGGSGDGKCKGQLVVFEPILTEHDCTYPPIPMEVQLKTTPTGQLKKTLVSLKATASSVPDERGKSAKDKDNLRLLCLPSLAP